MKTFYLSLLGSALLAIIVLGWLIDAFSQQTQKPVDEFVIQSKLIHGISNQLKRAPADTRLSLAAQLSNDFGLNVTYKSSNSLALPPILVDKMQTDGGLILEDSEGFYILYSNQFLAPYHLSMRLDNPHTTTQHYDIILTLLFYIGLCVVMGVIIAPLAKRLAVLNVAAQQFAAGNTQSRIKTSRFTYIKNVEKTFNSMAEQIEKLVAENKLMASSLSHDIRTPIACLRFGLDAAFDCDDKVKVKHYLTRMEHDLDHMESMLKSYLAFATLEQNANKITYTETNLKNYLEAIIDQLTPKLHANQINITLNCNEQIVYADLHWLARAITNLINNACDFAHHQVFISAQYNDKYIIITVEDDGPGVTHENHKKIFSPFFRASTHRNRSDKSYGLGLAIVEKVAQWHQGTVEVSKSELLNGACFTLKIARL